MGKDLFSILTEYRTILERVASNDEDEKVLHRYFEKRTLLLPGIIGSNHKYHHGIYNGMIFTEPSLFGSFNRRPDFMFITKNSQRALINMIEIEKPSKNFFIHNDNFSQEFNAAYQQLEDWKSWCEDGNNSSILKEKLIEALQDSFISEYPIKYEYTLIYGRSSDYQNNKKRCRRLAEKTNANLVVMSFDRLDCYEYSYDFITVRKKEDGTYAVQVDEDYNYTASNYNHHHHIKGLCEAIANNEYMTNKRKKNLVKEIEKVNTMTKEEREKYFYHF